MDVKYAFRNDLRVAAPARVHCALAVLGGTDQKRTLGQVGGDGCGGEVVIPYDGG